MKKLNSSFKKTLLASLVVPFALGAASVSAAPITNWGYTIDNNFSDAMFTDGTGSQISQDQVISWGNAADGSTERSSIEITDVGPETGLITNGAAVSGGVFSHNNATISTNFATLESFKLTSSLTLVPAVAPGLPSLEFASLFTETPNNPTPGSCAFGVPPCGDIFTLGDPTDLNFEPDGSGGFELSQDFTVDGYAYTVYLQIVDLQELTTTALCGATSTPCYGLLTPEGTTTTFETLVRIEGPVSVPEPGTLALLGLGIAGLGLSRRRLSAKS